VNAGTTLQQGGKRTQAPAENHDADRRPFYVVEAWPIVNNTQGGPEHDVKQRVLDPMKKPIPRLYVAGEISSIYGHLYLEAGNITECFVAGKIAGKNAASEQAWE
jgi:predicted oxidoreductase